MPGYVPIRVLQQHPCASLSVMARNFEQGKMRMTEIKTIKFDDAVKILKEVVEEVGREHKYPMQYVDGHQQACKYLLPDADGKWDKSGACLVGKFLAKIGVDMLKQFTVGDESSAHRYEGAYNSAPFSTLKTAFEGYVFTDKAAKFLRLAQSTQDNGHDWGTALDWGLEYTSDAGYNEDESRNLV